MPSTPIVLRYPLDRTGVNPNNRVVNEEHKMPNRNVRAIAPYYGPFFADSLIVKEQATQKILTKDVDYEIAYLYEIPSLKFGKSICAIILITNRNIQDTVEITYQVVGGEYSSSVDAIVQMVNSLKIDDRPVKWADIIGKPSEFDPAPHLHDIGDIYGFEYLVEACEGIRRAILMGDVATHDEIYRYIDAAVANLGGDLSALRQALIAHVNDFNNPHKVTAEQVDCYDKSTMDTLLSTGFVKKTGDTMLGSLTGATLSLNMGADAASNGSFIAKSGGTGNENLAGISFRNDSYGIKMGVRNDGVFGIGGWNRPAWSWYSDAAGNSISSGDVIAYSDPRLKENISKIQDPLDKIRKLEGVYFNWKNIPHVSVKAGKRDFGLLADQVKAILPEAVSDSIEIDGEKYMAVAYSKLIAVLIEGIKELETRVVELESR